MSIRNYAYPGNFAGQYSISSSKSNCHILAHIFGPSQEAILNNRFSAPGIVEKTGFISANGTQVEGP
jgi:hypothetical protein